MFHPPISLGSIQATLANEWASLARGLRAVHAGQGAQGC